MFEIVIIYAMFCNLISECIRINDVEICGCPPCKYKLCDIFIYIYIYIIFFLGGGGVMTDGMSSSARP